MRGGGEMGWGEEEEEGGGGGGRRRGPSREGEEGEEYCSLPVVVQKALRRRPNFLKKFSRWAKAKPNVPLPLFNYNKFIITNIT